MLSSGSPPHGRQTIPLEAIVSSLQEAGGNFRECTKVGQGTYAESVLKAYDASHQRWVAIKITDIGEKSEEIDILTALQGVDHVVSFISRLELPGIQKLALIFEYMDFDLSGLMSLANFTEISKNQLKNFVQQLLLSLDNCHQRQIMHRDVKAANILLNSKGELKLADFGTATRFHARPAFHSEVCTLWYRPPELLLGETKYGPKVDIWAAACVIFEIYTRSNFIRGAKDDETSQLEAICKFFGKTVVDVPALQVLPSYGARFAHIEHSDKTNRLAYRLNEVGMSQDGIALITRMLSFNPNDRPTAVECLAHPFFQENPLPRQYSLNFGEIHCYEALNRNRHRSVPPQQHPHQNPTRPLGPSSSRSFGPHFNQQHQRPHNPPPSFRRPPSQGSPSQSPPESPMDVDYTYQSPRKRASPSQDNSPRKRARLSPDNSSNDDSTERRGTKFVGNNPQQQRNPPPAKKASPPPPPPREVPPHRNTANILNPFFYKPPQPNPHTPKMINPYLLPPVAISH